MRTRWIVALPAIVLCLFSVPASAGSVQGLEAVGYIFADEVPVRSSDLYPSCGSEIENNINRNFDYEPFQQCPDDYFLLHYSGFITLPEHETVQFWLAHDDGASLSIGDAIAEEWWFDTGCSWSLTEAVSLPSGVPVPLSSWLYERGGNSCYMLAWSFDGGDLVIVPDGAFTTEGVGATTTTTASTTTTLVQDFSTTTTTDASTTTTSTSSSTTTSTVFYSPEPSTTVPEPEPILPTSTTTPVTPITTLPITITDETTVPPPQAPSVDTVATEDAVPIPTVATEPPRGVQSEAVLGQPLSDKAFASALTKAFDEPLSDDAFSAVLDAVLAQPLSDVQFESLVDSLAGENVTDKQVSEAVGAILDLGVSASEALVLAGSEGVLDVVSDGQAKEIFDALMVGELLPDEELLLVTVLSEQPDAIKDIFEDSVNVYSEGLDGYVPAGSFVDVRARRSLVAVSGMVVAVSGAIAPTVGSSAGKKPD